MFVFPIPQLRNRARQFAQTALLLCGLASLNAQAHTHHAYSHEPQFNAYHASWMQNLPDTQALKDISMPGSHDTMSFYGGDAVQTQSMSLENQLLAGIRVLDIRCRRIDNKFALHHGVVYQKANFDDVLQKLTRFLAQHPSESVLMRLSEEHTPANSSMDFAQIFATYANDPRYAQYFWRGTDAQIKLGEARGKIILLHNFSGASFGLPYGSLQAQDAYHLNTNWYLYGKWEKVKAHLHFANTTPASQRGFVINYLSGSGGAFPYFVASGHSSPGTSAARLATGLTTPGWKNSYRDFPRVNCFIGICTIAFEGTNVLTAEYLQDKKPAFVGIIMADFPGHRLIESIIERNPLPSLR